MCTYTTQLHHAPCGVCMCVYILCSYKVALDSNNTERMTPRIFVCLPAGRTLGSLSRAEHLRVERIVAGHLGVIMGDAVVLRRLVSKPKYNGCTGETKRTRKRAYVTQTL